MKSEIPASTEPLISLFVTGDASVRLFTRSKTILKRLDTLLRCEKLFLAKRAGD